MIHSSLIIVKNIGFIHRTVYTINSQKNTDLDTMTFFTQNLDPPIERRSPGRFPRLLVVVIFLKKNFFYR